MIKAILLDLDGTVYLGTRQVPGAARFLRTAAALGIRCAFVTNRANRTPQQICHHLRTYGIPCKAADIFTTAQVTAHVLKPGRAYCIGEHGLNRELIAAGFTITDRNPDYVIVSLDRSFNYRKLRDACRLIDAGAEFVVTNPDLRLKLHDGMTPGTGTIMAAVAAGTGRTPRVIGKPESTLFNYVVETLAIPRKETIIVGDNLETDVAAGKRAGLRSALILTGVSSRADVRASRIKPTWVVQNFRELTEIVRSENNA